MESEEMYAKHYKSAETAKFFNLLDVQSIHDKTPYYPNACHVCRCFGEKAVNLKRCSACGMISYCCKEHQVKDWPSHKQFCKVLCQIKKKWGIDHLFEPFRARKMMSRLTTKLNLITDMECSIKKINEMAGLHFIDRLMEKALEILDRPMKYHELQMLQNPRVCAVCFECDPALLTNCKKCPQASFCNEHLNDPNHENDCFKFISAFYAPHGYLQTVPASISSILDDMKLPLQSKTEKLPDSMTKFFEQYFPNVSFNSFELEKRITFNCYFSDKYTSSLSILLAMEKLNLNLGSLVIHVVGASNREQVFDNWEAILHYLPQLRKLKVILIGLELFPNYFKLQKTCNLCKKEKRKLKIETNILEYDKYCKGTKFEKPDIIACFNAGLHAYPTWEKSVKIFKKGQCPLLVTAYSKKELIDDQKIVDSKFPSAKCVYSGYNPFASMEYSRANVLLEVTTSNQFLFIYEHLGIKNDSN